MDNESTIGAIVHNPSACKFGLPRRRTLLLLLLLLRHSLSARERRKRNSMLVIQMGRKSVPSLISGCAPVYETRKLHLEVASHMSEKRAFLGLHGTCAPKARYPLVAFLGFDRTLAMRRRYLMPFWLFSTKVVFEGSSIVESAVAPVVKALDYDSSST